MTDRLPSAPDAPHTGDPAGAEDTAPAGSNAPTGNNAPAKGTVPTARRRWRTIALAGGAVAVLAAAALGYALLRGPASSFDSPEGIAALLAERGAPCEDFGDGGEGHADERGACYVDGEKIVIATFGSRAEVEEHWNRQLELTADNETLGMVIGDTWAISGPARTYLKHAAAVLKAEYRTN